MNLYYRLLLSSLIPLVAFYLLSQFQISLLLEDTRRRVEQNIDKQIDIVRENLDDQIDDLEYIADLLAHSEEIVFSVENRDNDNLTRWGRHFLGEKVDLILFTDLQGTVLARPHNEFHFADSVATMPYFKALDRESQYLGVAALNGSKAIVYATTIRKYEEIPVGYLVAGSYLDRVLIDRLTFNTDLSLAFDFNGYSVNNMHSRSVMETRDLDSRIAGNFKIRVQIYADKHSLKLEDLRFRETAIAG
ncbi:MAG: CHASE4 domain-containing protein, partial [Candidatus Competibacterales bacterium]|nr:CHASE4 domain-containing protein [Candidatus Competibacterales bacterium]